MSQVVSQLIGAGVMKPGTNISADYRGQRLQATITPDGQVDFRGAKYKSPSAAGAAAKQFVSGKFLATDGWTFWHYTDQDGARVPLSVAREQYIAKQKSITGEVERRMLLLTRPKSRRLGSPRSGNPSVCITRLVDVLLLCEKPS